MKFLEKLGLVLFSFIILVLAIMLILIGVGLVDVSIFSILIAKMIAHSTAVKVMYGVCAVLILIAIRCLFFGSTSSANPELDGILMENEDGKLLITYDTLETLVDGVINNVDDIIAASPEITITEDNEVYISILIDVKQHTVIKLITSKLQQDIKTTIKDATDIEVKRVDIQVREVEAEDVSDTDFEEEFADQLVEKPKKTVKVENKVDEEDEKILEEVIKKGENKDNKKDTKKTTKKAENNNSKKTIASKTNK